MSLSSLLKRMALVVVTMAVFSWWLKDFEDLFPLSFGFCMGMLCVWSELRTPHKEEHEG